jgi:hypothetical protein
MLKLTVSHFPKGSRFSDFHFFALHVHPLCGAKTAPLSRPDSARDASEAGRLERLTPQPGQPDIQGLRNIYGDGRTDFALAGVTGNQIGSVLNPDLT